MNATVELTSSKGARTLPLEDFFLDYGKQDRKPDELVTRIRIPEPVNSIRFYKISKRFEQDISAVMAAFAARVDGQRIACIRIAYGGMAAIPKRASELERYLTGRSPSECEDGAIRRAVDADFSPISDLRASKSYRSLVAANLVRKFLIDLEKSDEPHRLFGTREVSFGHR